MKISAVTTLAGLILACFLSASVAYAEDPSVKGSSEAPAAPPAKEGGVYRELAALRAENAILTEQLKNAKLREDLSVAKGASGAGAMPRALQASAPAYRDRGARVQFVGGVEGNWAATVQFSDGQTITARIGTRIPGVGVVKSIKTDEVLVQNGKEVVSLPMAAGPLSNASQYANGFVSGAPGGTVPPPLPMPGR